jgi:predicted MFS family arabinose efflux permease
VTKAPEAGTASGAPRGARVHRPVRDVTTVGLAMATSFGLTLSSVPLALTQQGVSPALAGLTVTAMLAATIATQPLVPALIRRFGTTATQVAGVLLLCGTTPLYTLHALPLAYLAGLLRGVGFAVLTVAGVLLATTTVPAAGRARAAALYGLATTLPNALALPVSVALTAAGHFTVMCWLSLATLACLPYAVRLGHGAPPRPNDAAVPPDAASGTRRRMFAVVVPPSVVLLASTLAGGAFTTYLPVLRLPGRTITVTLLLFGVCTGLARWRVATLARSRRIGGRTLLAAGCAVTGLGIVAIGAAATLPPGLRSLLVEACGALFGLGSGVIQNLTMVTMMSRAPARYLAQASALWNVAVDAGTALGALMVAGASASGLGVPTGLALTGFLVVGTVPLALRDRPSHATGPSGTATVRHPVGSPEPH